MNKSKGAPSEEYIIIFRTSFRHPVTGKIVRRPDGRPMPLKVRVKR